MKYWAKNDGPTTARRGKDHLPAKYTQETENGKRRKTRRGTSEGIRATMQDEKVKRGFHPEFAVSERDSTDWKHEFRSFPGVLDMNNQNTHLYEEDAWVESKKLNEAD